MRTVKQVSDWVRIPGIVLRVLEKSVIYLMHIEHFPTEVIIPLSQIEVRPMADTRDLVVKRWLVEKNGWPHRELTQ